MSMLLMKKRIKLIIELGRIRFLSGGFFLYTMGVLLAIDYIKKKFNNINLILLIRSL